MSVDTPNSPLSLVTVSVMIVLCGARVVAVQELNALNPTPNPAWSPLLAGDEQRNMNNEREGGGEYGQQECT